MKQKLGKWRLLGRDWLIGPASHNLIGQMVDYSNLIGQ